MSLPTASCGTIDWWQMTTSISGGISCHIHAPTQAGKNEGPSATRSFAILHGLWLGSRVSEAPDGVDIEQIGRHVQEEVRRRLASPVGIPVPNPGADQSNDLTRDLAALRASVDVYDVVMPSGRRLLAPFLTAAKRAARRLLTPSLARQVTYNVANLRLLEG